jgi:hypothetical protein
LGCILESSGADYAPTQCAGGLLQVWQPKQSTTQTPVNKGQAMPKKLRYIAGLRGAPSTRMNVVQLQLDLGQPHQH